MSATEPRVAGSAPVPLPDDVWTTARLDTLDDGGRTWRQLVVTEAAGRDGVVVVARRVDGTIGLVRQWRHAVGADVWELPRGYGEARSAAEDARREVAEELQVTALEVQVVGRLWANTGLTSGAISVVDALVGGRHAPEEGSSGSEVSAIEWLSVGQAEARLHAAEPTDGISVAALALWRARTRRTEST